MVEESEKRSADQKSPLKEKIELDLIGSQQRQRANHDSSSNILTHQTEKSQAAEMLLQQSNAAGVSVGLIKRQSSSPTFQQRGIDGGKRQQLQQQILLKNLDGGSAGASSQTAMLFSEPGGEQIRLVMGSVGGVNTVTTNSVEQMKNNGPGGQLLQLEEEEMEDAISKQSHQAPTENDQITATTPVPEEEQMKVHPPAAAPLSSFYKQARSHGKISKEPSATYTVNESSSNNSAATRQQDTEIVKKEVEHQNDGDKLVATELTEKTDSNQRFEGDVIAVSDGAEQDEADAVFGVENTNTSEELHQNIPQESQQPILADGESGSYNNNEIDYTIDHPDVNMLDDNTTMDAHHGQMLLNSEKEIQSANNHLQQAYTAGGESQGYYLDKDSKALSEIEAPDQKYGLINADMKWKEGLASERQQDAKINTALVDFQNTPSPSGEVSQIQQERYQLSSGAQFKMFPVSSEDTSTVKNEDTSQMTINSHTQQQSNSQPMNHQQLQKQPPIEIIMSPSSIQIQQKYGQYEEPKDAYPSDVDILKFQKNLDDRMKVTKEMIVRKQQELADEFSVHEVKRRAQCTYTIASAKSRATNIKKSPQQQAYDRRVTNLLYKDRFDRKLEGQVIDMGGTSSIAFSQQLQQKSSNSLGRNRAKMVQQHFSTEQDALHITIDQSATISSPKTTNQFNTLQGSTRKYSEGPQQNRTFDNTSSMRQAARRFSRSGRTPDCGSSCLSRKQAQRIKTMKMSSYFKRPKKSIGQLSPNSSSATCPEQLQKQQLNAQQTLQQEHQHSQTTKMTTEVSTDADNNSRGGVVLKLRLLEKQRRSTEEHDSSSITPAPRIEILKSPKNAAVEKRRSKQNSNLLHRNFKLKSRYQHSTPKKANQDVMKDIELVPAPNIFHADEHSLKHELIDARKAKRLVSTLRHLRTQISKSEQTGRKLQRKERVTDEEILESYHNEEAVNVLDGGKLLSIDLRSYQKKVLAKEKAAEEERAMLREQAELAASRANSNSNSETSDDDETGEESEKPKKVTDKETYEKEMRQKKRDWRHFISFMKRNPEALMSLTEGMIQGGDEGSKPQSQPMGQDAILNLASQQQTTSLTPAATSLNQQSQVMSRQENVMTIAADTSAVDNQSLQRFRNQQNRPHSTKSWSRKQPRSKYNTAGNSTNMPYKQFSENATITCSPPTTAMNTSCFTKSRYKNSSLINKTSHLDSKRGYRRFSPGLRGTKNQISSEQVSKEYTHGGLVNNNFLQMTSEPNMEALSTNENANNDTKTSSFNLGTAPHSKNNLNTTKATRQLLAQTSDGAQNFTFKTLINEHSTKENLEQRAGATEDHQTEATSLTQVYSNDHALSGQLSGSGGGHAATSTQRQPGILHSINHCSMVDNSLNPIAEEKNQQVSATSQGRFLVKKKAVLSHSNLKNALQKVTESKRRNIVSAHHGRPRATTVNRQFTSTATLQQKESKRLGARLAAAQYYNNQAIARQTTTGGGMTMEQYIRLGTMPNSSLQPSQQMQQTFVTNQRQQLAHYQSNYGRQVSPPGQQQPQAKRRRAQTACLSNKRNRMRTVMNNTAGIKSTENQHRQGQQNQQQAAIAADDYYNTGSIGNNQQVLNKMTLNHQSEVAFVLTHPEESKQKELQTFLSEPQLSAQQFADVVDEEVDGGESKAPEQETAPEYHHHQFRLDQIQTPPMDLFSPERLHGSGESEKLTTMLGVSPYRDSVGEEDHQEQKLIQSQQQEEAPARKARSQRRYPQCILKQNQKLLIKSALDDLGSPVGVKDIKADQKEVWLKDQKQMKRWKQKQMWERLSIRGLMDRVEHLFSLYPFTNEKILGMERKRLDALRAKPKPPYIMAHDLMKRLDVPRLEDFGPGGLYGYTRAQLEEMERLANLTPSSHTSSMQREQFASWKLDVEELHKEVILLEFNKKKELYTMQDIIASINYLKRD